MLITSLSILSSIILTLLNIYYISKMLDKRIELKSKSIVMILLLIIVVIITKRIENSLISIMIQYLFLNIVILQLFEVKLEKCIMSTTFFYLILMLSDLIGVLILNILNVDIEHMGINEKKLIGDILVIGIIGITSNIKIITNTLKNIIYSTKIKVVYYIILTILAIGICYLFFYYNIFNKSFDEIIINIITITLVVYIFIKLTFESSAKQNVLKEYEKMNEYVKVYEDIIEKDRIQRHENKNQLITIKGMVSKRDKKTHEYIDSLVQDNNDMSNRWVSELKNIPIGGLKGLLFYKVNKMRNEGIEVNLTISRSLENSKLQDIDVKLYKQLCQIIGVYVDNAIEACLEADIKNIGIEIYKDKDIFEFIISNTYKGYLDIENIDSAGYTTKGNGHGYGLSLVKDIINSNPKFFQNREIINDYYIQHLFLDLTEESTK